MSINLKRISRWCNFSRFRFVRRRQTFLLVCYKLIWQVVNFFFILTTMQFTDTGMSIALWKSIKLLILLVLKTYPTHELVRCSDEGGGIAFSLILIRRKSHSFFFFLSFSCIREFTTSQFFRLYSVVLLVENGEL